MCEVVHWIERQWSEAVSLSDLARRAGLSPYRLLRSFQSVVGMSPRDYRRARRTA